ncbi:MULTISPECIES: hypothetical protein [unclassified Nitratiruptor]|uniref:hypothetical protein n=1 Tax=unclassified Nitratiruptor TaxID=2624044 RepID=UPI0019158D19|nr:MULTISPECIES: hypothetical protein [unclassified Nitratiruptor]BCD59636.1 hypothetical protein NitYY0810_C0387 [Nitratiruptor sp. YY08-10]BCD63560.1 hypothetical protein NitYY0814_C0387 [Nitratiruptor sp. YY08-14]BCD83112.1 hypothetical protein NrS2_62 [Nitratiruptor phage NrS-2]BCD83178.1 hypothetical protein NrS3_62 [Nitratiruptor phage NrS-3]
MYIKIDDKTLKILAITESVPNKSLGTTIIEDMNITTKNPDYVVVWRESGGIKVRERTTEEKAKIDEQKFRQLKTKKLRIFEKETKSHIETSYPEIKQRSDVNDKEYWGAWLISHFPSTYTTDNLYQKFFTSAARVIEGTSDFQTEVENLKEVATFADTDEEAKYAVAIDQLLKVSVRQGWVQACKAEYAIKSAVAQQATTFDELNAVSLNLIPYPLQG